MDFSFNEVCSSVIADELMIFSYFRPEELLTSPISFLI